MLGLGAGLGGIVSIVRIRRITRSRLMMTVNTSLTIPRGTVAALGAGSVVTKEFSDEIEQRHDSRKKIRLGSEQFKTFLRRYAVGELAQSLHPQGRCSFSRSHYFSYRLMNTSRRLSLPKVVRPALVNALGPKIEVELLAPQSYFLS